MSTLAKWYLAALKSHPLMANASTAVLLMSAGDAMAQGIEQNHQHHHHDPDDTQRQAQPQSSLPQQQPQQQQQQEASSSSLGVPRGATLMTRKSFSFLNRHATLSPHLEVAHCDYGITRLEWESPTPTTTSTCSSRGDDAKGDDAAGARSIVHDKNGVRRGTNPDAAKAYNDEPTPWQPTTDVLTRMMSHWDGTRTVTMAVWAGAVQAPFFCTLYRWYDRFLPVAVTPYTVAARVTLSFVSTIPFTAAFFGYGTLMHSLFLDNSHHQDEYCHSKDTDSSSSRNSIVLQKEECDIRQEDVKDSSWNDWWDNDDTSFWHTVTQEIVEKWSQDLVPTLQTSATVWVPFNAMNFSLVPAHLRPLGMMIMSAGWNCYLSLVQHR